MWEDVMGEEPVHDVVVVKIGGAVPEGHLLDELARRSRAGELLVLVHGGGRDTDALAAELGRPVRHLVAPHGGRSRRTDAAALDTLTMALAGRVKPRLVAGLAARGVVAAGLTGADGATVTAVRKPAIRAVDGDRVWLVRDDLSGRPQRVDPTLLSVLLRSGILPVLSPPAIAEDGALLNVDADRVAAKVAVALGAAALVLLTDVPGVLADPADRAAVLHHLDADPGVTVPGVSGRMWHKVHAAREAVAGGVGHVVIGDGTVPAPVGAALAGAGTRVLDRRAVA
jgi:acetylglutamate/LysW-gamma-L-alpha-aminoadipate kinase